MLSLLRGAFQRSAKVVKANKLMVYPGVIAAAAATCFFSGNNYNIVIKNQAVEKDEVEEESELKAFREDRYRLYRKAFFDPHYNDDGTVVFPPMNGRTVYEMVCDYEEEEEEKKNNNNDKKFPPSAPRTRQTSISEIEEKMYDEMRLEIQAKLRGMNTSEFLDYAKREKAKCKEMCEKCKKFPISRDCDYSQVEVNMFCGST